MKMIRINNSLYFLLILALGFFLRLVGIDQKGIWGDEKISISNATGVNARTIQKYQNPNGNIFFTTDIAWENNKPKEVFKNAINQSGGNAIAYNLALHYWIKLFGTSDFSVRFLSLIFGIGIMVLGFFLVNRFLPKEKVALLTFFLLSINFFLIRYSQETRAYSMATFFCLLATFLLLEIVFENNKKPKKRNFLLVGYGFSVLIAFFSHFLTLGFFIGHFVFLVLFQRNKGILKNIFVLFLIGLIPLCIFLLGGGYDGLKVILSSTAKYGDAAQNTYSPKGFALPLNLHSFSAGVLQDLLFIFGNGFQNFGIQIRFIGPLIIFPAFIIWKTFSYLKEQGHVKIFIFLILPVITQLFLGIILAFISGHNISFQVLYYIFPVPLAMILIAIGIKYLFKSGGKPKNKQFYRLVNVPIFFLIAFFSLLPIYFKEFAPYEKRNINPYIDLANRIIEKAEPGDTIVYGKIQDGVVVNFYLPKEFPNVQKIESENKHDKIILRDFGKEIVIIDFSVDLVRY